nr:MAG TPA: hypothetical protein [Caudoviricetes sp.]
MSLRSISRALWLILFTSKSFVRNRLRSPHYEPLVLTSK